MWKKGQSGNPKGRPKRGDTWAEIIRSMSEEVGDGGISKKEAIVSKLLDMALEGDIRAINCVLERVEGKAVAPVAVHSSDSGELPFKQVKIKFVSPEDEMLQISE
jgi:hypothetical protein